MPLPTLRVIAAPDAGLLPYVSPEGRATRGRFVGRAGSPPFEPRAEVVAESTYILRALARGEIVLAPEAPAPALAPAAPSAAPAEPAAPAPDALAPTTPDAPAAPAPEV